MPILSHESLPQFILDLDKNKPIQCDEKGSWTVSDNSTITMYDLLGCKNFTAIKRFENIVRTYTTFLNQHESQPVIMDGNDEQKIQFARMVIAADSVTRYVNHSELHSPALTSALNQLQRCVAGLYYRYEKINGGLDKVAKENAQPRILKLTTLAIEWMRQQELFRLTKSELDETDKRVLERAGQHSLFAQLIINDPELKNSFFNWCLRDVRDPAAVETFIQFPALCTELSASVMDKHIGYHNPHILKITLDHHQKTVQLPFVRAGKTHWVNVLDKSRVIEFNLDCQTTVAALFKSFAGRKVKPGNIELCDQGFINWNSAQMAWWYSHPKQGKPHLSKFTLTSSYSSWWNALPPFQTFSKEQIKSRYHLTDIPNNAWIKCAIATCQYVTYGFEKTHGEMEIAIPTQQGHYQIFPFSIYPVVYASGIHGLTGTRRAQIYYPDEGLKVPRIKAFFAKVVGPWDGIVSMTKLHKAITQSRAGNLYFQTANENCAEFCGRILESKEFPSCETLYGVRLRDMNPMPREAWYLLNMPNYVILPLLQYFADINKLDVENEQGEMEVKKVDFRKKGKDSLQLSPPHLLFQIIHKKLPGFVTYANEPSRSRSHSFDAKLTAGDAPLTRAPARK